MAVMQILAVEEAFGSVKYMGEVLCEVLVNNENASIFPMEVHCRAAERLFLKGH